MSKHRRTPPRPRLPLTLEPLESRESPTNLLGLGVPFSIGGGSYSVVQQSDRGGSGIVFPTIRLTI